MQIALQKKQENSIEYILYMWQIEALIRSCNCDITELQKKVIATYGLSGEALLKLENWYLELVEKMKAQKITQKGHLGELRELIAELDYNHKMLLTLFNDDKYKTLYETAGDAIEDLKNKANDNSLCDVEICLVGLYGYLSLKINQKEISEETQLAINSFTKLMAYLNKKYGEMKNGKINLPDTSKN